MTSDIVMSATVSNLLGENAIDVPHPSRFLMQMKYYNYHRPFLNAVWQDHSICAATFVVS